MAERFTWISAYEIIATKLLEYENRQDNLVAIVEKVLGESHEVMDPLTFFSMFNGKRINYGARHRAVGIVLEELDLAVEAPTEFDGVPTTNPQRWRFWNGQPGNIEKNWAIFRAALALADASERTDDLRKAFIASFNTAVAQGNVGEASLTMALFWARPTFFLPLDGNTSAYLRNRLGHVVHPIDGEKYLSLLDEVKRAVDMDLAQISYAAWEKGGWIPAPSEYDPGIPAEQWVELLNDPEVTPHNSLIALKCLSNHPKGATCTELSEFYGRNPEFYNAGITLLGENVSKRESVVPREADGGKYWPIICFGNFVRKRRHGKFEWKLRDELRKALESVDLSQIPLSEADENEAPAFEPERFKRLVKLYKKDFPAIRSSDGPKGDREIYKWDDLLAYRKHWDLDAEDLPAMIADALKPSATGGGALLDNGFEHPYDRLLKLAAYDAEAFREAFRKLYNPDNSLRVAYTSFSRDMDDLLQHHDAEAEKPLERDFQEPKAASVYLFFEKPSRYHIYKYSFAGALANAVGVTISEDQLDRFYQYEALCDALMPLVDADDKLIELGESVLTSEQAQADEAHHLLLQDIAYYADRYMKGLNGNWEAVLNGEEDIVVTDGKGTGEYPKNIILYGPPGTGKTYQSRAYAVAICEGRRVEDVLDQMKTAEGYRDVAERYRQYEKDKRIGFTTFHQSFGYEEFIEGIRPVVAADDEGESDAVGISYEIRDGVFKEFCQRSSRAITRDEVADFGFNDSPTVWKVSLQGTGDNPTRTECLANGHIRIGWDEYGPEITDETDFGENGGKTVLNAFITKMREGDIVLSCYSSTTIDAIGVITGDAEWHDEYDHYKRLRPVNWIAKGLRYNIVAEFGIPTMTLSTVYKLKLDESQVAQILDDLGGAKGKERPHQSLPCVFIIDEINRGNVSKVFGELITLLEEDKRKGEPGALTARLPYSNTEFSVPSNVYVLGTMNTADRSITHMDTALRRRFSFREIMPDPSVLDGVVVEGVDVAKMLDFLNRRISLLHDRDHMLGHSYLIPLRENATIARLRDIFRDYLIPLLQEYFFDDYGKIGSVLGAAASDFIEELSGEDVFWPDGEEDYDSLRAYTLKEMPRTADAYRRIYQTGNEVAD